MDVTVAVATFGAVEWFERAQRAIESARVLRVPVVHVHLDTLHAARNAALAEVATEWVVHLDGDDELEPGFVEAIAAGTADVRAPAVRYVRGSREHAPYVPRVAGHTHDCSAGCLEDGNWLVVGSAMRTSLAREAGGWHDWPLYEDWDLFLRLYRAGATFEALPEAVYRAHVDPLSRNRAPSMAEKNRIHYEIVAANAVRQAA